MGEKFTGGLSTKMRNLLACGFMMKGDYDRALKVFEEAVKSLSLDTEEGQALLSRGDQPDIAYLMVNYIKCNTLKNGQGLGLEFFKTDPVNVNCFIHLKKMQSGSAQEFIVERQRCEAMFDEAAASF
jgi:hypothetical protein